MNEYDITPGGEEEDIAAICHDERIEFVKSTIQLLVNESCSLEMRFYKMERCNLATHKTVAVLNGRDGNSLKEWLGSKQHVKAITRDRASAYAKVISEVLPRCYAGSGQIPFTSKPFRSSKAGAKSGNTGNHKNPA